jgi:hypothetical protein
VCSREKTLRVETEFCVQGAAVKRNFDKTWEVANGEGNLKFNFRKDCIRSFAAQGKFWVQSQHLL